MMKNTIYASFSDPKLAEKAAGALLDHGLKPEDLSIIEGDNWPRIGAAELVGPGSKLAAFFYPGAGFIFGSGPLASAVVGKAAADTMAVVGTMTGFLKDQGVESDVVAAYERAVNTGGAVLGATLPSGAVDEGHAWAILDRFAGLNVISYENRPYVS